LKIKYKKGEWNKFKSYWKLHNRWQHYRKFGYDAFGEQMPYDLETKCHETGITIKTSHEQAIEFCLKRWEKIKKDLMKRGYKKFTKCYYAYGHDEHPFNEYIIQWIALAKK